MYRYITKRVVYEYINIIKNGGRIKAGEGKTTRTRRTQASDENLRDQEKG